MTEERLILKPASSPLAPRQSVSSSSSRRRLAASKRHRRRHPERIDAEIRRLERREVAKSWGPRLGLLAAVLALSVAEFTESGRDWLALLLVVGLPIGVLTLGAYKLHEAEPRLRTLGFVVSAAMVVINEAILLPAALAGSTSEPSGLGVWAVMLVLVLAAAAIEGVGARRGTSTRFGAFTGMAAAFTLYLGTYGMKGGLFDASLAALVVALLVGGGAGVALGLVARGVMGARL
jgi:hypothetical protein